MSGAFGTRSARAAGLWIAAGLLAGCGTADVGGGPTAAAPQQGSALSRLFAGGGAATPPPADEPKDRIVCPEVDVRSGTAAYRVYHTTREGQELRYQAVIGETARECAALGQTLTIKVGVEGRLLAGPAGTGAPVTVPLRIAVVREGPTPKPLWSKLYRIPVQIPAGQLNTSFIHVEEDLSLPLPPAAELENYVIYVGFDPDAPEERRQQNPRQRPRQTASSG